MSYPKKISTLSYPVQAKEANPLLKQVEPLITPKLLKSRFLKGIFDRLPPSFQYTDEELKDMINVALNDIELELKAPILATKFSERHPFDFALYKSWIHIRTKNGPIVSVDSLRIESADRQNLFLIPSEWVDMGQAHQRQINVIPLLGATGIGGEVSGVVAPGGVAYLFALERHLTFLPSYWTIDITAGFCPDYGQVPVSLNNLIGVQAAIDILSPLALANPDTSVSLSQDGIGQSKGSLGPRIYELRIRELEERKQRLLGQLKRVMSQKYFITNI